MYHESFFVANVQGLVDLIMPGAALYLVAAADEYYSTKGKSPCMMAALPAERP